MFFIPDHPLLSRKKAAHSLLPLDNQDKRAVCKPSNPPLYWGLTSALPCVTRLNHCYFVSGVYPDDFVHSAQVNDYSPSHTWNRISSKVRGTRAYWHKGVRVSFAYFTTPCTSSTFPGLTTYAGITRGTKLESLEYSSRTLGLSKTLLLPTIFSSSFSATFSLHPVLLKP